MTAADVDLAALLAHAEAATPGPWHRHRNGWGIETATEKLVAGAATHPNGQADAAFIAACDPDTIRSLVQRVKDAEAKAEEHWQHSQHFAARLKAIAADRDRLVTALTSLADTADQEATTDLGNLNDSGRVVPLGLVPTRKIRDLIEKHGGDA